MAAIPSCPAAMPKSSRLGLTALGVDSPIAYWLGFNDFRPNARQERLNLGENVNTGSLSTLGSQTRLNRIMLDPSFEGTPTANEWRQILPWVLDGAESGTGTAADRYLYGLSNTLSKRYMLWDDTQTMWDMYEVAVDSATFSCSQGDPALKCSLDMVGTNYDKTATWPGGVVANTDAPFIFTDTSGAITVGGTPIKAASFSIRVEKNVARDRFFNSQTIACAVSQNRKVTVSIQFPWGLHNALFLTGMTSGVAVVATFTSGVKILTFTMPNVFQEQESPSASVPSELMGTWTGIATASASLNDELAASLAVSA